MAQIKEQIKSTKIELSNEEKANLSDAQFTGNQDAHRNGWVLLQNGGKIEDYAKWNKENIQGTNSEGKETRTQINSSEQKEERNIQPEQNEETRHQKTEERLRNLQDNFKRSNIWIIWVPEGDEEEKEMENLFEQIMKENFPNLAKEIDFQEVQEAQRVQRSWTQGGTHQGTL